MLTVQAEAVEKRDAGLRSPRSILVAQYSVLISIGTGIASVTYFSISGPDDTVNLVGNAINVVTLMLSTAYLVTHQFTAWRYSQSSDHLTQYRINKLRSVCLRTCAFVILAWLTNSVLGLMAAAQAPFCEASASATSEWKSIIGCRIHRASVAGSIMAVVNSCLLFYGIANAQTPFAASLAGVHAKAHSAEQEMQLSTEFSFSTFEHVRGEKSFDRPSCDPNFYCKSAKSRQAVRAHRSWLPPLKFQMPDEKEHPALQSGDDTPISSRQPTPLLPVPLNDGILSWSRLTSGVRGSMSDTSQPTTRAASSIYSRSVADSEFSREASTVSSTNHDFPDTAVRRSGIGARDQPHIPDVPAIPAIPARYRHPSHSLRNGGQPLRPGSKPAMQPANFWLCARAEQQRYNSWLHHRPQTICADSVAVRPRTGSGSSGSGAKASQYLSGQPLPAKGALQMNMDRANIMKVTKRSYESVRKERDLHGDEEQTVSQDRFIRSPSRKLMKKRQPWD